MSARILPTERDRAFHAHLDVCPQCEKHPFDLCPEGEQLLTGADRPAEAEA